MGGSINGGTAGSRLKHRFPDPIATEWLELLEVKENESTGKWMDMKLNVLGHLTDQSTTRQSSYEVFTP